MLRATAVVPLSAFQFKANVGVTLQGLPCVQRINIIPWLGILTMHETSRDKIYVSFFL